MLSDDRIEAIISQVMGELEKGEQVQHQPVPQKPVRPASFAPAVPVEHGDNLYPDVDSAVAVARQAHEQLHDLPLSIRDAMVANIRRKMRENAHVLGNEAVQETGMGRYEDKVDKILLNANKSPGTEMLEPKAWSGDGGLTLVEYAPYGVIGSIIPSTNPVSSVVSNAICMIAAGNAVVFNAHPAARQCSNHAIQLVNQAIVEAGGPKNLVTSIDEPTIQSAEAIMAHPGINLLVVTGGAGVVRAAMQSGKRAICAGPGNPPVVVDETADLEQAGRDIVRGASFDNNIVCIAEKEVFAVHGIADQLKQAMLRHGAVEIDQAQLQKLMKAIMVDSPGPGQHGTMNKKFVGKNANVLLREIGIEAGDEVRLVVVDVPADHPLVYSEQMMPVLPIVRVRNAAEGIDMAKKAEHGFRHTASMYSKNLDNLSRMARAMDCSIFVKNGPTFDGLGYTGEGYCSFTIASPTGEGITSPVSFSRIRRCVLKDAFRIV